MMTLTELITDIRSQAEFISALQEDDRSANAARVIIRDCEKMEKTVKTIVVVNERLQKFVKHVISVCGNIHFKNHITLDDIRNEAIEALKVEEPK